MAKMSGGNFRTPIYIKEPPVERQPGGYEYFDESNAVNIFGEDVIVKCWWNSTPFHRTAYNKNYENVTLTDDAITEKDFVHVTVRYNKKITYGCLVYRLDEETPYEITGINNTEDKNRLLEIQLKRVDFIG